MIVHDAFEELTVLSLEFRKLTVYLFINDCEELQMWNKTPFETARQIVLNAAVPVDTEQIPLEEACGRILAQDIVAAEDVPPFDRSPYDGYAFRSEDTAGADRERPVCLSILEEVPAGKVPSMSVTAGTAVKVLTGSPIPPGADAVIMYEKTEFTAESVKIFAPVRSGANIIYAGEDVKRGMMLAHVGTGIDAGLCGTAASQNMDRISVFRKPVAGIISTGSELLEAGQAPSPGKVVNTNRYTLSAELVRMGFEVLYLGIAGDSEEEICEFLLKGIEACDVIMTTGGVSVGDYDLTVKAMERAGIRILLHGVDMKPGMACAYGEKDGKLICALSGNPASSLVSLHAVAAPALRKILGLSSKLWLPEEIMVEIVEGFRKPSPSLRFLRGKLDLETGTVRMHVGRGQGNVVLSGSIGTDVMAMVPAGSGPIEPGTRLQAFLL
ncbi:MAG: molybdopterin molybdotransferase MoeA [Lachnospiraceae bacterium]|nr:molybdopterin molybdotransferase MoeA [Lachnospiraceae bacterium]